MCNPVIQIVRVKLVLKLAGYVPGCVPTASTTLYERKSYSLCQVIVVLQGLDSVQWTQCFDEVKVPQGCG